MSEEKPKKRKKRADAIINDALIEEAFTKIFVQKKRKPTWPEVAKEVNLDEKTIRRHFQKVDLNMRMQEYRMGTGKVMAKTFIQATTGKDVHHKRLWFEIVEGLGKKKEVDFTGASEVQIKVIRE
jgi:hypothetical protein